MSKTFERAISSVLYMNIRESSTRAIAASRTRITLAWTDASNDEGGFRIERSANGIGNWQQIATLNPGAASFQDSGLVPETTRA